MPDPKAHRWDYNPATNLYEGGAYWRAENRADGIELYCKSEALGFFESLHAAWDAGPGRPPKDYREAIATARDDQIAAAKRGNGRPPW